MSVRSSLWWHLLRRGALAWVLVRLLFAIALALILESPMARGGLVSFGVVGLATAVAVLDVRRAHERVLLANLGIPRVRLIGALGVASLAGELLLALVVP